MGVQCPFATAKACVSPGCSLTPLAWTVCTRHCAWNFQSNSSSIVENGAFCEENPWRQAWHADVPLRGNMWQLIEVHEFSVNHARKNSQTAGISRQHWLVEKCCCLCWMEDRAGLFNWGQTIYNNNIYIYIYIRYLYNVSNHMIQCYSSLLGKPTVIHLQ